VTYHAPQITYCRNIIAPRRVFRNVTMLGSLLRR
jgi:hypothetical protein